MIYCFPTFERPPTAVEGGGKQLSSSNVVKVLNNIILPPKWKLVCPTTNFARGFNI
ncbi:MAG: hypothetical protein ACTS46_01050 [Candidatus Hodgkinia cicadicola]